MKPCGPEGIPISSRTLNNSNELFPPPKVASQEFSGNPQNLRGLLLYQEWNHTIHSSISSLEDESGSSVALWPRKSLQLDSLSLSRPIFLNDCDGAIIVRTGLVQPEDRLLLHRS